MSAARQERAERIRESAELIGGIVSDLVLVVVDHADEIAEWSLKRRAKRATMPPVGELPRGRSA